MQRYPLKVEVIKTEFWHITEAVHASSEYSPLYDISTTFCLSEKVWELSQLHTSCWRVSKQTLKRQDNLYLHACTHTPAHTHTQNTVLIYCFTTLCCETQSLLLVPVLSSSGMMPTKKKQTHYQHDHDNTQ